MTTDGAHNPSAVPSEWASALKETKYLVGAKVIDVLKFKNNCENCNDFCTSRITTERACPMQHSEVWDSAGQQECQTLTETPGSLSLALRMVGNFPLYFPKGEQQQCNRSKDPMHVSIKLSHSGTCRQLTPAFAYIARGHRTIDPLKQFLGPSGLGFLVFLFFFLA